MSQTSEFDDSDGDETTGRQLVDIGATVALARAQIDQQVSTAKTYPRFLSSVKKDMLEMVMLDPESAKECMYLLPIEGASKPIIGPSVRFAEALFAAWGNCSVGSRIVEVNRIEMFVEAEGVFWDMQTNARTVKTSRRSIRGKRGRVYPERVIITTCGAAMAIAGREAVIKGVPQPVWREAFALVLKTVKGDVKTLVERRTRAVEAFAVYQITPERVFARLGVSGIEDIGIDELPALFAMYQSIKNGEETVENLFPKTVSPHDIVTNELDDTDDGAARGGTAKDAAAVKSNYEEPARPTTPTPKEIEAAVERLQPKEPEPAPSSPVSLSGGAGSVGAEPSVAPLGSAPLDSQAAEVLPDADRERIEMEGAKAFRLGAPKRGGELKYPGESNQLKLAAWRAGYDRAKGAESGDR